MIFSKLRESAFYSVFILTLSTTTWAQSTATPTPLTRQQYLDLSNADFEAASSRFKLQIRTPDKYVPCDAELSYFERNYADWYRQNEAEIWAHYDSLDGLIQYINEKIANLRIMQFEPLVVRGQKGDPTVTFNTVLDYLSDLSIRKKKAIESKQLHVFEDQMTKPEFSPFELSLNQVIDSIKNMSERMNTSLKEQGVQFKIHFKPTTEGYALTLEVTIDRYPTMLPIDLLSKVTTLKLQAADKWKLVASTKIGPYSIDGHRRLLEMREESKSKECIYSTGLLFRDRAPYLSQKQLVSIKSKSTLHELAYSSETWLCDWGGTGKIEIGNGQAKIIKWGSVESAWIDEPVQMSNDLSLLFIRYKGNYDLVWVKSNLDGSHGPVSCTLK
jgi:hypothetical protein